MEWLHQILVSWPEIKAWLEANDRLAGWAQAFGAVIALILAIGVPAWQRYSEKRSAQITDANRSAALAQSLFYLLRDVEIFLSGLARRGDVPRKVLFDPVSMDDLLSRISALESREETPERVTALFRARGALIGARSTVVEWLGELPYSDGDIDLMQQRVQLVKDFGSQADKWMGDAYYRREITKRFLFVRMIAPLIRRPIERVVSRRLEREEREEMEK